MINSPVLQPFLSFPKKPVVLIQPSLPQTADGDDDWTPGPGEYRLLPVDLLLPARSRRFTPIPLQADQPLRGPKFRLQRIGRFVFRPRVHRLSPWGFSLFAW
jgi:hypothetical protein